MLTLLLEVALRSFVLGAVAEVGRKILRVDNPHVEMTAWKTVRIASVAAFPVRGHGEDSGCASALILREEIRGAAQAMKLVIDDSPIGRLPRSITGGTDPTTK